MKQFVIFGLFCSTLLYFAQNGCTRKKSKPIEVITNSIGMKLVWIPAGEFIMGSPSTEAINSAYYPAKGSPQVEKGRSSNESPQHPMKISKGFWMGIYEVTQKEYQVVMGSNPSIIKRDNLPVDRVSWNDATEFCRKLSQKEGKTYRLPTEAEWEYACRARTQTRFYSGDDDSSLDDYAWCYINISYTNKKFDIHTHPVGQKKANAFGLYDMHGNVSEWCQDWYNENYYSISPEIDPKGPDRGQSRVIRGGCWMYNPLYCRSAARQMTVPDLPVDFFGFRIVLEAN
jgi:formylglycine-generating enzyme required for sulfatase activity